MIEFETPSDIPYVVRAGINYVVPRGPHLTVAGTTAKWGTFEKNEKSDRGCRFQHRLGAIQVGDKCPKKEMASCVT